MASYFLDSSALLKRYVNEAGSPWVVQLLRPSSRNHGYVANLASVEVVAALSRRPRSGNFTSQVAEAAIARFLGDFGGGSLRVIDVLPPLVERAVLLTRRHALRGYDAVQLAAAVEVNFQHMAMGGACVFVSSDRELNLAAAAEGLRVEDPNLHP